jgi:hypothetical protein
MSLLEGTNLYGATQDRRKQWKAEYEVVKKTIEEDGMTWYGFLLELCKSADLTGNGI